jgi:hypothetical protein
MTALALVAWSFVPSSAHAGLVQWVAQVNTGTPATFVATNVFTPSVVDIGTLSGDITYEFVVNGADRASAGSLIGSLADGQSQAIRFEQFPNTNEYGVTQYRIGDYVFGVTTTFGADVDLAFVVNSAAGTTALFVNGTDTGTTVPVALTLHGQVGVGATYIGGNAFLDPSQDSFEGTVLGFATYDAALSSAELKAHADAYFGSAAVPEPATGTLFGLGFIGFVGYRWFTRKTKR